MVWKTEQAEKAFNDFEKKMSKIAKANEPITLLEYLTGYKQQIQSLPVSTKEAECTIQRFILYLLPVFKMAEL